MREPPFERAPIGLIGGMSSASTALYYDRLNRLARERLGGLHSADIVLWSVDFAPIAEWQANGDWTLAAERLAEIAKRLEATGAGVIVLATNTMHKVADAITAAIDVPFLHIADAAAERVRAAGWLRPAVIATRFTMEDDFYIGRLRDRHGLEPVVPETADCALVHRIIYEELCKGTVRETSRTAFEAVVGRLADDGADCLILGCTEVGMLLSASNVPLPVFDTTHIHCERAIAAWLEAPRPRRGGRRMKRGETSRHGSSSAAFAFAAPLLLTAFLLAMVSAGHAQPGRGPGPRPEVPIVLGHDPDLDACGSSGVVAGLRHDGDGFLAVRGGPGADYPKLDEIHNGRTVFVCDQDGSWYGIVYSGDAYDTCNVTSPWAVVAAYTGPCRSGWAHRDWITITAG